MNIPLIKPFINQEVKDKVNAVLDSGMLTEGSVTRELETAFKNFTGCEYTLAVTSCTTGLELALRAIGVGPGDEVIVPDYTYPATATVVSIVGATPVIVDVDPQNMLIDYEKLEQAITSKTKAVIPVSIFGNPLDYTILNSIKEKYGLILIEDAACSIGSEFNGIKTGNLADISVFSLHPRKFITTGEGGIITTNCKEWFEWMDSYKHFGIKKTADRESIAFEQIGTNYKLSNILSAVGVVQMKHLEELLQRRVDLSENYISLLKSCDKIKIPLTTSGGKHSRQSMCIYIEQRDRIMKLMRAQGIEVQIGTYSLHLHTAFQTPEIRLQGDMNGSLYAFHHCLALPLYHDLSRADQEVVVSKLIEFLT